MSTGSPFPRSSPRTATPDSLHQHLRHTSIGANQLFDNKYRNYTIADNLSYQWGDHQIKGGFLFAWELKDEPAATATQGTFNFVAGGGRTAFQNFLTGNRDGLCGSGCTYSEYQTEVNTSFDSPATSSRAGLLEGEAGT